MNIGLDYREMNNLIGGSSQRIYINLVQGCKCKCKYCYLPSLGFIDSTMPIMEEIAVKNIFSLSYFKEGNRGTILSFGCYSEYMDPEYRYKTFNVISSLVKKNNYIQIATKQVLTSKELDYLNDVCEYKNQIGVYYSLPTLTRSAEIETGTPDVYQRIKSLIECSRKSKLYGVLYIKPVLPNITILDIEQYKTIIRSGIRYCVVGPMLHHNQYGKTTVGVHAFTEEHCADEQMLINALGEVSQCYRHSTEIIEEFRREDEERIILF